MESQEGKFAILKKRKVQVGIGLGVLVIAVLCGVGIWRYRGTGNKPQVGVKDTTRSAELSTSGLGNVSKDESEVLGKGEANLTVEKKALEDLFKRSGVAREVFDKLIANPPQVNSAGEVKVGDTFTEEEKKVVKSIDKDTLEALKKVKVNEPIPKVINVNENAGRHETVTTVTSDSANIRDVASNSGLSETRTDDVSNNNTETNVQPPPNPPPLGVVKKINLAALKTNASEIEPTFGLLTSTTEFSVIEKDGDNPNEQLKTELVSAVQAGIVTLPIFRKLVNDPSTLTPDEMVKIVGEELRKVFRLASVPPPPPPPPTKTIVDITAVDANMPSSIKTAFDKLNSTDLANLTIKISNNVELADALKANLIGAIKDKEAIFTRLIKGDYSGLSTQEDAVIYGLDVILKAEFRVPPKGLIEHTIELFKLLNDEDKIKSAFALLSSADTLTLSVIKAAGENADADLKNELIAGIKSNILTEALFIKMVNRFLTDADADATDALGQHVKDYFQCPIRHAQSPFDKSYGEFTAVFKSVCDTYEGNGTPAATELAELRTKLNAAVEAAKSINPADIVDAKKKMLIENRLNPNLLGLLFFAVFKPKFESAVKDLTTERTSVDLYWGLMRKNCKVLCDQIYGMDIEQLADVKILLAVHGNDAAWTACKGKVPALQDLRIMPKIEDDVVDALLKFPTRQDLFKFYFDTRKKGGVKLIRVEGCLKKAQRVHSLVESYNARKFVKQEDLEAKHTELANAFNGAGECKDVFRNAGIDELATVIVKTVVTDQPELCDGYLSNLKEAIEEFMKGKIATLAVVDGYYIKAKEECQKATMPAFLNKDLGAIIKDAGAKIIQDMKNIKKLAQKDIDALEAILSAVRQVDPDFEKDRTAKKILFAQFQSFTFSIKRPGTKKLEDIVYHWNSVDLCCESGDRAKLKDCSTLPEYLRKLIDEATGAIDSVADRDKQMEVIWKWIEWHKALSPGDARYTHFLSKEHLSEFLEFKRLAQKFKAEKDKLIRDNFSNNAEVEEFKNKTITPLLKVSENVIDGSKLGDEAQKQVLEFFKQFDRAQTNADAVVVEIKKELPA